MANAAKLLLGTFNFIAASVGALFTIFTLKMCKQCPFFGEVQEVRRIFTGGSIWWCMLSLTASVISMCTSLAIFQRQINPGKLDINSTSRYLLLLKVCLIWTFLAALMTSTGLRVWCASFKVNSCMDNRYQDWNAFRPKYSDCFGLWTWQINIVACLWVSFLCQFLVLLSVLI